MDRTALALLAASGGMLLAVQAPVNARLRSAVGSPLAAGLVSFAIGTVLLLVLLLASGGLGGLAGVGGGPWWAYLGGVCGTAVVVGTLISTPRIGVLATFVAVIVGEVAMATAIDRFGWFGVTPRPLAWDRILALVLLLSSLVLVVRSR